ncbi:IclR family transcriptional regulator domain-containing protein [Tardiphaga robiniae]|uniref:IclR family transcriptional regulator domain-containing protein n=1 Tax=Tardiphaga robiniae TaxID=943830 RepID=UPI003B8A985F
MRRVLFWPSRQYVPEFYCVAAPVLDQDNRMVAAIGIGVTASDFEMNKSNLVREMIRAAQQASRELGWQHSS